MAEIEGVPGVDHEAEKEGGKVGVAVVTVNDVGEEVEVEKEVIIDGAEHLASPEGKQHGMFHQRVMKILLLSNSKP